MRAIYIYILTKSVKWGEFHKLQKFVRKSHIYYVKRMNICWGADSQIKCQQELFKTAFRVGYKYYHLISGVDLPLIRPKKMTEFLEKNSGKEFIGFDSKTKANGADFIDRVKYYHIFQRFYGKSTDTVKEKIFYCLEKISLIIQKTINVNRIKNFTGEIYKGGNWCSITHELVEYLLENENTIKKYFYNSLSADELYLHTMAMNSPFKDNVINKSLRYTDWSGGGASPKILTSADYSRLTASECFFARKFSTSEDIDIIQRIVRLHDKKDLEQ